MKNKTLRIYHLLVVVLLAFQLPVLQGQGWVRSIGVDSLYNIVAASVPHPDGGVVVAYTGTDRFTGAEYHAKLTHYNANGDLLWSHTVLAPGAAKALAIEDGGSPAILAYDLTANKMVLAHYDWQGNALGSQLVGDYNNGTPQLAPFPGGGFVSDLPYRSSPSTPPTKIALHRFDAADNLLWRTDVDALQAIPVLENYGLGVNAQGQSIVAIRTGFGGSSRYYLSAIGPLGDTLWQITNQKPVTAGVLTDGNFFYLHQLPNDLLVLRKLSPTGELLWEKPTESVTTLINRGKYLALPDAALALIGLGPGPNGGDAFYIQVFDSVGNLIKSIARLVPGYPENGLIVSSFAQAPDGGFYVTGTVGQGVDGIRSIVMKMDAEGNVYPQRIWGNFAFDANDNCAVETGELGLEDFKVQIEDLVTGNVFYSNSDSAGIYFAEIDSTQFAVSAVFSNPYWETCQADTLLDFSMGGDSIQVDFPLQKVVECAFLEVDIGVVILRRCFDNTYYVHYCNTGTADAQDAYTDITLDPYLSLVSSTLPAEDLGNNQYRFQLGLVPFGDCGSFQLKVYLDCDSTILGQTHCVEAHIYPDSFCLQSGLWSGANVDVNGVCGPDSVELVIKNTGTAPNANPLSYIIIEDNLIFLQGTFQLSPGDSLLLKVPGNGATWRLEAEQEPFSPGDPMPSATVEGCGQNLQGNFSIGFVSQFGENDGNPYVSVHCQENQGSYDPNDKQGFPKGVGDEHWIEPGTELEYLIRFQNTGTDTAFRVEIRDTLAQWLDPASVRPGASSHAFDFPLSGAGNLRFPFDNILLPDSTTNEPASQGFVKFSVKMRPDVPLQTVIQNQAAIYFDFNEPVLTNTTFHTLGKDFLGVVSSVKNGKTEAVALSVSPNPASDQALLKLTGWVLNQGRLEVLDAQGRVVTRQAFKGQQVILQAGSLPSGLYLIRVFDGEQYLGSSKLVWQR